MTREIPGEVAMTFQVRDLMSNVFPMVMQEHPCAFDSTHNECDRPDCGPSKCQGQSGCPQPSQAPPKVGLEMLSALRAQMRQALPPA